MFKHFNQSKISNKYKNGQNRRFIQPISEEGKKKKETHLKTVEYVNPCPAEPG